MRTFVLVAIIFFARLASAQVLINEVQIAPINERFIELYNSDDTDIDLTDWYIQRKTATGSSFGSLVTSTQFSGKTIKAHGYFLISRSQLEKSDIVAGSLVLTESNTIRIRDSKGNDVDQVVWGSVDEGKSYQKTSTNVWQVTTPTPGAMNASAQEINSNTNTASTNSSTTSSAVIPPVSNASYFPVEPQIFSKITAQTQIVSVGAATTFTGRVWGLKKEPIENARMVWAFGDGASAEGASVLHTYYYPGEYTVIIDASSGYYAASDRVRIVAVTPLLALRTGGDEAHSFVVIENRGNDELDLSEWQVDVQGKTFTIPKNTLIGVHKTLTLASEVTGLTTPAGSIASLRFPNGTLVSLQAEVTPIISSPSNQVAYVRPTVHAVETKTPPQENQEASVIGATQGLLPENSKTDLLVWYVGLAFFAAIALLGLRFARKTNTPGLLTADDFEIIDEDESEKNNLF